MRLLIILLLVLSGVAFSGCVPGDLTTTGYAATLHVLPGDSPASDRWYQERLDHRPGVLAGLERPRRSISVTRTRGGLRVGLDGRVRDTLQVRTWSESVVTGVR